MSRSSAERALSSFSTRRPVGVLVVFLAAGVFGLFSYGRLPVTLMPELTYPTLTVRTEYPGAAPEEVENDISRPVEEALGVVSGLQRISSISRAGISDVVLEFTWDTKMSEATQDALERLDLVFLPPEAERPLILQYDPSLDPVMEYSLTGEGERFQGAEGLRRLRRLAELQVKRALEPIKGVAAVRVRGGLEEEIHVLVDEDRLRRSGLSADTVIQRLRQENINVAGGTLKEGRTEYMVRTLNEYQTLQQIEETVLVRRSEREIRIKDIGRVEFAHKERQILTRTNGGESVQIEILKEADANMVAMAKAVKEAVGELDLEKEKRRAAGEDVDGEEARREARAKKRGDDGEMRGMIKPVGIATNLFRQEEAILTLVADRSTFIESSVREVVSTAVIGGLLAVVVLFLFLRNARSTAIVAVSIPISLLIAFAPLHLTGVSLNIMSLGGLALGIGMLVDSSIVVLESIFRCREEGRSLVEAAVQGTREVQGAVAASTLTSIAVFFPMVFVEGIAGQAFGDLGLAVVISLLASLGVAVFFIPMLASRQGMKLSEGLQGRLWFPGRFTLRLLGRDWSKGGVWRFVLIPYLLVRTVLGLVFETIGFFFMVTILCFLWLGKVLGGPLSKLLGSVARPALGLTGRALALLQRIYPRVLRGALANAGQVLFLGVAILVITLWAGSRLGNELLPEVHQGEFTFEVSLPVGTPLEATEALLAPVEEAILAEREYIEALVVTYGFDPAISQRSDEGEHSVRFKAVVERPRPNLLARLATVLGGEAQADVDLRAREEEVIARIRRKLAEIPDLEGRVTRPVLFSFRTPVEVEIQGEDLALLKDYGGRARDLLADLPELTDVETSLKTGAPEVQIVYDRDRLARYGLNIQQVAQLVRDQVRGAEATRFNLKDRRVPVVVRLAEGDRENVADVRELLVNPGGERPIPLSAVADASLAEGPSEVRRVDGQRVALISANLGEAALGTAVARIESTLSRRVAWPQGMGFVVAGQNEEWQRSRSSLWLALALSVFLVYVIMAAQFESLLQPLVILLTIPLALFGTVLALWLLEINLSIVVFLGVILLAGIVVNNAIVLVDYINRLRRRGVESMEAIVTAGRVRLRPILMTTATTVLGLVPMALGLGDGAEIRTPMAIAVISGLVASTLLTLLIIPVTYSLLLRMTERFLPAATGEPADAATDGETQGEESPLRGAPALEAPNLDPDPATS